jgi:hypothetical protein
MFRSRPSPFPWLAALVALAATVRAAPPRIDFAREIRPLLAQHCLDCHGAEHPKGQLMLTHRAFALRGGESGEPAIVPGASARSALLSRLTTDDDNDVMPQKAARLPADTIAKFRRWIDEGAEWPDDLKHWAYEKPTRPTPPAPSAIPNSQSEIRHPIDAFVRARLPEGLAPAPAADKPRWLRRVSLDLIGLPPTAAELEAFLADASPAAPERVVDRLLASPHYGERWARPWLDLARYADSHGFQRDDLRDLWPYRDWVIRALNADLPFDQFTIHQLAGDLLPAAEAAPFVARGLHPVVATGFHRSAPTNVEAGTDQEEGRVNQVFDRVNTTAAVWLGTTLECAQCHNHKYDPFSLKDYYRLFAFFNHTPVETDFVSPKARAALKFTGPFFELPDPAQDAARTAIRTRLADLDRRIETARTAALERLPAWEAGVAARLDAAPQTHPLEIAAFESAGESNYRILPDRSVLLVDDAPDRDTYTVTVKTTLTGIVAFKLEALADPSLPGMGPGRGDAARPNFILNQFAVTAETAGSGRRVPVAFAQATASYSQSRFEVAKALTDQPEPRTGWAIGQQFFRDHWAIFETAHPVGDAAGTTFTFTLVQNFGTGRTIGRLRLSAVTGAVGGQAIPADLAALIRQPAARRSAAGQTKVRNAFFAQDQTLETLRLARTQAAADLDALRGAQTLVMQELPEPRPTHVLNRGSFLDPGEIVTAGTPATLHAFQPRGPRADRLDLARWLVSTENPLVARVAVNRAWAEFFGRGLVATVEDFGAKGDPPTHPELLDWLATEFMARGWSQKQLHKLIVLSATYGQSSRLTPELLARDDQNLWLARGPRFRLDAETIRDNALALAGLLSPKQFGPPVRPYQPPGLWENKVGGDRVTYDVSTGEDAHRRGLYTVWKRSSPYPSFMNFDATARTACTLRRSRSNTPLQALTLLNDPVYVAAARSFAARILKERPDSSPDERLRHAFQLALTRPPTRDELAALRTLLDAQRAAASELTAWQAVTTVLLNLDETITKG